MASPDPQRVSAGFDEWVATLEARPDARRRPHTTYAELWRRVARLPASVSVERIGVSAGGEPLWSLATGAPGRGTVLVIAALHAMEHVGTQAALALIERAAAATSAAAMSAAAMSAAAMSAEIKPAAAWAGRRLVVVPLANPDGFRTVEKALAEGRRRFFRTNARGVDLNRNFAAFWDDKAFWNRFVSPVFSAGAGPLSEPESAAIDGLAARERPDYAVSLHAFGEMILIPYAGSREPPPHLHLLRRSAEAMAARMPRPYRVLRLGDKTRLFSARGAELDHFYRRHDAQSFLFEIGGGPSLTEPGGWLWPYRWYTPAPERLERDVANVLPALDWLASAPPRGAGWPTG